MEHGGSRPLPGRPLHGHGGTRRGLAGPRARPLRALAGPPGALSHLPAGDRRFLANTGCAVLRLLAHMRRAVRGPESDVIGLCDELGTPKLLFQATSLSERASKFLQACGTYCLCRVELGVPGRCPGKQSPPVPGGPPGWGAAGRGDCGCRAGTEEEHLCWSFMHLLEHPSPALTGGELGAWAQPWGVPALRAPSPISGGRGPAAAG
uniref:Uncharacterized protein n=1 Tax=Strix occidentalis caurina TaxID=311401 RepID=A0A8D0FJS1_STROC